MTNRNNDDIANALHGLASGQHAEPDHAEGSGTGQAHHLDAVPVPSPAHPAPPPQPAPPPPRPPAASFRATPKPMPPAPQSSAPSPAIPKPSPPPMRPRPQPQPQPSPSSRSPIPPAPQAPARAATPVQPVRAGRGAAPPGARPGGPLASPNLTPPGDGDGAAQPPTEVETTNVEPVDEDDRVIVPAAPLSSLGPRTQRPPTAARVPLFKTLKFRRTAIPVLLTTGAMLIVVAGLRFVVDPDAALATVSVGACAALAATGLLLLGVAAVNMAQVRGQMAAERAGATPAR